MPDLRSVVFAAEGWTFSQEDESARLWENATGDVLSLHYFAKQPDLAGTLSDIGRIRNACRAMVAQSGGALVEVEADELANIPALRTILKFPQQHHGMSYIGAWTIPRKSFSFVIKICCAEHGTTGVRDTIVYEKLHRNGTLAFDPDEPFAGWSQDPYDPSFKAPILRNRSDDEEWDALLPQHPLSRARACLRRVRDTIILDENVRCSDPFEGPVQAPARKGWWRRLTGR